MLDLSGAYCYVSELLLVLSPACLQGRICSPKYFERPESTFQCQSMMFRNNSVVLALDSELMHRLSELYHRGNWKSDSSSRLHDQLNYLGF